MRAGPCNGLIGGPGVQEEAEESECRPGLSFDCREAQVGVVGRGGSAGCQGGTGVGADVRRGVGSSALHGRSACRSVCGLRPGSGRHPLRAAFRSAVPPDPHRGRPCHHSAATRQRAGRCRRARPSRAGVRRLAGALGYPVAIHGARLVRLLQPRHRRPVLDRPGAALRRGATPAGSPDRPPGADLVRVGRSLVGGSDRACAGRGGLRSLGRGGGQRPRSRPHR